MCKSCQAKDKEIADLKVAAEAGTNALKISRSQTLSAFEATANQHNELITTKENLLMTLDIIKVCTEIIKANIPNINQSILFERILKTQREIEEILHGKSV